MTEQAPVIDDDFDDNTFDERSHLEEVWTRVSAWVLSIGGAIAFIASFTLTVEKFEITKDPNFVPSCNISPILSCGSVMVKPQAGVFGFPNPLMGIAGFAIMVTVGMGIFAGARYAKWYWAGLQLGVTFAICFVHWLIFQSLYRSGAWSPYCMVVWSMTIPIFLFVTVRNLHAFGLVERSRVLAFIARNHAPILVLWFMIIIVLIANRFWSYWSSLY